MKQLKISHKLTNRENESFKQYLKEIGEVEIFSTPEEEFAVAQRASLGDKKAIDELVKRNLRFVVSVAKQYVSDGILLEDLVNEGNIGLMMAAEKFTPSMGYKFISYAVWWIRKVILEHIAKNGKMVRIPANKLNSLSKLDKKIAELEQMRGRKVDVQEVIEEFGNEINDDDFMFLDVLSTYNMDSLDRQVGNDDGGSFLGELIADESFKATDHLLTDSNLTNEVSAILSVLKPRDVEVMECLFGLNGNAPMTLKEVGDKLGITRERARQIRENSLIKLRHNARVNLAYNELD
jgi:RNA polymerase primary sigma factor